MCVIVLIKILPFDYATQDHMTPYQVSEEHDLNFRQSVMFVFSVVVVLQERVFDNCGDIEDLPLKSVKRVIRDPANYPELPATTTGKRRHQATIYQDNTVIFIDDTDKEDDEKFVAKKQRLVSYGSKDIQRHVQYSSPPSSKNISYRAALIPNVTRSARITHVSAQKSPHFFNLAEL